ncbi:DUF5667 domain-containing protein [Aeromicrobium sp.]|uniref:DUF5667 domain-containing protein n=1 Tax=Aeromicrobium sp. TaxID=1871063 RepID=UPI003C569460
MIGRRHHDDAQAFDEAWSGRAPSDEHIAVLVQLAEQLCEAAVAEPSTQFRDTLRQQLMTEAATVLVVKPPATRTVTTPVTPVHPIRRRVAGVTAALVASAGVVGLVASSASAVPGEMLYPVKRSVESVELALHRSDESRGSFQLAQASERLAEAQKLSADGGADNQIADTLDDFSSQATEGSTSLFNHFTDSGDQKSIRTVNDFAASATAELATLSSLLPTGADSSFDAATDAISDLATRASSLCSACTTADVQQLVAAVTGLTSTSDSTRATVEPKSTSSSTPKGSTPRATAGSSAPVSASAPVVASPTTSPTAVPSLTDVTDPLVGALLGGDEQLGVVPGLLNGLLGGGSK